MRGRDRELYESLIDDEFWFTEFDCQGDLVLANDREEELDILGNREGTSQGVFDLFREFQFDFSLIRRHRSWGRSTPRRSPWPGTCPCRRCPRSRRT